MSAGAVAISLTAIGVAAVVLLGGVIPYSPTFLVALLAILVVTGALTVACFPRLSAHHVLVGCPLVGLGLIAIAADSSSLVPVPGLAMPMFTTPMVVLPIVAGAALYRRRHRSAAPSSIPVARVQKL